MAKPKPKEKDLYSEQDCIRRMPPRTKAAATAWLLRESGTEPMLFEMAVARGLIEWLPVIGQWAGALFGKPEETTPVVEDVPAPAERVEVAPVKRAVPKPAQVVPSGQLELF